MRSGAASSSPLRAAGERPSGFTVMPPPSPASACPPAGPCGPGGPASPAGPAAPGSPLSPLSPLSPEQATSEKLHVNAKRACFIRPSNRDELMGAPRPPQGAPSHPFDHMRLYGSIGTIGSAVRFLVKESGGG